MLAALSPCYSINACLVVWWQTALHLYLTLIQLRSVMLYNARVSAHGDSGSESDGEEVNRWNLRKCSAAGLDVLSTVFGDELLPSVIPVVEQRLQVHCPLSSPRPVVQLQPWESLEGCQPCRGVMSEPTRDSGCGQLLSRAFQMH